MSQALNAEAGAVIDAAAHAADHAIRNSQRAAQQALDHLAATVEQARSQVGPAIDGLASDSVHAVQRASDAVLHSARQWRSSTRGYIEHQPLQAVLIAMAAGATLVLLGSLFARGRHGGR